MNKNNTDTAVNRKSSILWGMLSFAAPAAALLPLLIICGIAPFGGSTLISDVNSDWFSEFCSLYQSVTEGESIFYHFNTGFGSSFYSDFVSGLCSPFMFVALFFSESGLTSAYSIISLLRAAFAGYFAWLMLRKTTGCSAHCAFAAACGYALCGFTACSIYYPSIADCSVFFPLFVIGIHCYVYEARPIYLFIFGTLFFVTSPTMLISGIVTAFLLYAAFYFKRGNKKQRVYKLAMFAAMTLCSAAVTAILIIPAGASALYYEGGLFSEVSVISPAELLPAIFFGGCCTSTAAGTGYFCLSGMLIMGTAAFMFNGKIHLGERISLLAGIMITLISSIIMPLGTALLGLNKPENELFNLGFVLAVICAYCTARNFTEAKGIRTWGIVLSAAIFALSAGAALAIFGSDVFAMVTEIGLAVVFTALFVKVCYDRESPSVKTSAIIAAVIAVFGAVHCFTAVTESGEKYSSAEISAQSLSRTSTVTEISRAEIRGDRSMSFFRYRSIDNSAADGVDLNQNVIDGFSQFARQLGIIELDDSGGGANFTPLTDLLFGVRYIINDDKVVSESDAELSPAYKVDEASDITADGLNAFEFQNQISEQWFGTKNLFVPAEYTQGIKTSSAESDRYKWTFGNESTAVSEYIINLGEGETLYMLDEGCDYGFAVNDDSRSAWQEGCKDGIYKLISAETSGEVKVYFSHDSSISAGEPIFMTTSADTVRQLAAQADVRGAKYISRRGNAVKFMMNCVSPQTIVTSMPYEYGWDVTVNGKSAETVEMQGGLIGIKLKAGSNSIVMEYRPPFFRTGMVITIIMFTIGLYMAIFTEHEAYRRRKVRMAFRAVELNLERQSAAKIQKLREEISHDDSAVNAAGSEDINKPLDDNDDTHAI